MPYSSHSPRRQGRISLTAYLSALSLSLVLCLLSIHALSSYAPPQLSGQQEEQFQQLHRKAATSSQAMSQAVGTSWNNLANALGGFGTSFVHAPELNISWTARPSGFGGRVVDEGGLRGQLTAIGDMASGEGGDVIARRGCGVLRSPENTQQPWIAFVERGTCPFAFKIQAAQQVNASAVIVYNDASHASAGQHSGPYGMQEDDGLISMYAPMREAGKIHIPSVFVSYNTGKTLESLLAAAASESRGLVVVLEAEEPPHMYVIPFHGCFPYADIFALDSSSTLS